MPVKIIMQMCQAFTPLMKNSITAIRQSNTAIWGIRMTMAELDLLFENLRPVMPEMISRTEQTIMRPVQIVMIKYDDDECR